MAQRPTNDFDIDPNITSGTDLANILNRFQDAIDSGNSGASRPGYLAAGGLWVKEGDPMRLYLYDGTRDIELYNTTDGLVGASQWEDSGNDIYYNKGNVGIGMVPETTTFDLSEKAEWMETRAAGEKLQVAGDGNFSGYVYALGVLATGSYISVNNNGYIRGDYDDELRLQSGVSKISFYNNQNNAELAYISDAGGAFFSGTVTADQFVDKNGPIVSAFAMVDAFRKIKNAVADETTVEGIKESLTNVLGGLIEEFESIGTQES